jgi:uroporphyrinogen decarboxylase
MTPRERVWAALRGEAVDRPPISFWGHFYHRESSAADLVDATIEFQARYHWDWVKLNPRKHYHVEPWGVRYQYSGRPGEKPLLESVPIRSGDDWNTINEVSHEAGALGEQLDAVRRLRRALPEDVPMIETVFTPLAILGEMVREPSVLKQHLSTHAAGVRRALEAVTRTYERFTRAVIEAGADGIFFATVDWGSRDFMSPDEYRQWARPFDERILRAVSGAPFNVLHVCKSRNLLLELVDYPVAAFSWAATDPTNPSLADVLARARGAVMGGIAHEGALQGPDVDEVLAALQRAAEQTGGRRWLAAPGCSIPPTSRPEHLEALREAIEGLHVTRERSP